MPDIKIKTRDEVSRSQQTELCIMTVKELSELINKIIDAKVHVLDQETGSHYLGKHVVHSIKVTYYDAPPRK